MNDTFLFWFYIADIVLFTAWVIWLDRDSIGYHLQIMFIVAIGILFSLMGVTALFGVMYCIGYLHNHYYIGG